MVDLCFTCRQSSADSAGYSFNGRHVNLGHRPIRMRRLGRSVIPVVPSFNFVQYIRSQNYSSGTINLHILATVLPLQ